MRKTTIVAAIAIGIAVGFFATPPRQDVKAPAEPSVIAPAAQPEPAVQEAVAAPSRRERIARLVAETAAATAERTVKATMARQRHAQETAAR